MREDEGVVVDVDDPRLGRDALGDLVGVVGRGQAGADVEELPDAGLSRQVAHRTTEEQPVHARVLDDLGEPRGDAVADLAVDRVVVLAAEPVVPDARRVGHRGVDLRRRLQPGRGVVVAVCHGNISQTY